MYSAYTGYFELNWVWELGTLSMAAVWTVMRSLTDVSTEVYLNSDATTSLGIRIKHTPWSLTTNLWTSRISKMICDFHLFPTICLTFMTFCCATSWPCKNTYYLAISHTEHTVRDGGPSINVKLSELDSLISYTFNIQIKILSCNPRRGYEK